MHTCSEAEQFVIQVVYRHFYAEGKEEVLGLRAIKKQDKADRYSMAALSDAIENLGRQKVLSSYTMDFGERKAHMVAGFYRDATEPLRAQGLL